MWPTAGVTWVWARPGLDDGSEEGGTESGMSFGEPNLGSGAVKGAGRPPTPIVLIGVACT